MNKYSKYTFLIYVFCFLLISCKPDQAKSKPSILETKESSFSVPAIPTQIKTTSMVSSNSPTIEYKPSIIPGLESAKLEIISPLESIPVEDLFQIVSNPFYNPTKGQDDGHQGVDFSFYQYKDFSSINNHPINSIFPGRISSVINDRPPYGNAVIIETNFDLISEKYIDLIQNLNLEDEIQMHSNLNCPDYLTISNNSSTTEESLFVLYGHLLNKPQFSINDEVNQGQLIGNVGSTGMSGNPHLHLETRVGPSHATFNEMAHYINNATTEEMKNYCLWRVSNFYKLFDPMLLFLVSPTKP